MARPSTKRSRRTLWISALAVVALAGLGVGLGSFLAHRGPAEEPVDIVVTAPQEDAPAQSDPSASSLPVVGPNVGNIAPDFTLAALDGTPVTLSSFRDRVVILDFWASWCSPCRATMPSLHAYWKSVKSRGVVLVGVSLDRTLEAARSYLKTAGFDDMVSLWGSLSAASAVAALYDARAIPRTVVIDPEGVIRFSDHPARLARTLVESLL
ncbi:MAG: TlpA disulfide reductase family protein [Candidatus Bipolaricaulota bacterium]